jgi:ABC-type microcin C transport system permease subunit YejE
MDGSDVKAIAIIAIAILEIINLFTVKLDQAIMGLVIGAIAGIAGYKITKKVSEGE